MKFRTPIAIVVVCFAVPAHAQQIFLNDADACHLLEQQDGDLDFAGNGGLILDASGFSSLEYFCSFQPELQFNWDNYHVTTHMGHCESPGPFYEPKLFTFVQSNEEPGVVLLYSGGDQPTRFYSCPK